MAYVVSVLYLPASVCVLWCGPCRGLLMGVFFLSLSGCRVSDLSDIYLKILYALCPCVPLHAGFLFVWPLVKLSFPAHALAEARACATFPDCQQQH